MFGHDILPRRIKHWPLMRMVKTGCHGDAILYEGGVVKWQMVSCFLVSIRRTVPSQEKISTWNRETGLFNSHHPNAFEITKLVVFMATSYFLWCSVTFPSRREAPFAGKNTWREMIRTGTGLRAQNKKAKVGHLSQEMTGLCLDHVSNASSPKGSWEGRDWKKSLYFSLSSPPALGFPPTFKSLAGFQVKATYEAPLYWAKLLAHIN